MMGKGIWLSLDKDEHLRRGRVSEDEFEAFSATVLGSLPLTIQTISALTARPVSISVLDMGDGPMASCWETPAGVTARDDPEVARDSLHGRRRRHLAHRSWQGVPGRARAQGSRLGGTGGSPGIRIPVPDVLGPIIMGPVPMSG